MSELQTTGTSAASASPHFGGRSQGLLGRPWAGVAMLLVLYLLLIGLFTALSPVLPHLQEPAVDRLEHGIHRVDGGRRHPADHRRRA